MHSHLGSENTVSQNLGHQRNAQSFDGEYVAQLVRYYRRLQNPYVSHDIPLKLVSGKSLYAKHKKLFDNFAVLAASNNFDVEPYIKFCVKHGMTDKTLDVFLAKPTMLNKYFCYVKKSLNRKKIYRWFMKSAKNIAEKCVEDGLFTTKDFLRQAIDNKLIGTYVLTGKVSLYFFAAIPNFKNVISKLDFFSQQELRLLDEHFDIYHSEVNKAFLQEKNMYINPIDFTDKLIWKLREKK